MSESNELWIKNELIPTILAEGKLSSKSLSDNDQLPVLKDVSVKCLTTSESFMLTLCYKVQVVLEENGNEYKLFLVVKVRDGS